VAPVSSSTPYASSTIRGGITNPMSAQNRAFPRLTAHLSSSENQGKHREKSFADWAPEPETPTQEQWPAAVSIEYPERATKTSKTKPEKIGVYSKKVQGKLWLEGVLHRMSSTVSVRTARSFKSQT